MDPVALAYMPLVGLAVGSFLTLIIDRIPRGVSIVSPRSQCDRCHNPLGPLDLVPLISYLWLRGRCRYCGAAIPLRTTTVEVGTSVLFGLTTYVFGLTPFAGVILAYGSLFIAVSVIDMERLIIPDKLVLPGVVLAFAAAHFGPVGDGRVLGDTFVRVVAGGALGFGAMLLVYVASYLVYRSSAGFGFGDVKLGALIGLVIGFPEVLIALYFAFLLGGVIAVILLALRLKGRRDVLPYGPFLAAGALVTLIVNEDIGWYIDLFR